jgi:hypothetical protein
MAERTIAELDAFTANFTPDQHAAFFTKHRAIFDACESFNRVLVAARKRGERQDDRYRVWSREASAVELEALAQAEAR